MAGRNKKNKRKKGGFRRAMLRLEAVIIGVLAVLSILFAVYAVLHWGLEVTTRDLTLDLKQDVIADDFVVADNAENLSIGFEKPPVREEGTQEVIIVVKNRWGTSKKYKKELTYFQTDFDAPKLLGVTDINIHVGDTISYLDGVIGIDEQEGAVTVNVEQSAVNTRAAGVYPVYYSAADKTGNTVQAEAKVIVSEITATEQEVYALADKLLERIVSPNMSIGWKIFAVFEYCREHIVYTGNSLSDNWDMEAYKGLENLVNTDTSNGDCRTYCSVSMALLERVGAKVRRVSRIDSRVGNHHWVLCNIGTGWYHFDTTNIDENFKCFMLTDSEAEEYNNVREGFFKYDKALYPVVAQTKFVIE